MKTVAILDDYDNNEEWHHQFLKKARELSEADYVILVMAGDFTENGLPTRANKYSRAREALKEGADIVLEIPICAGLSDQPTKIFSGIALLKRLYSVDNIVIPYRNADKTELADLGKALFINPRGDDKKKEERLLAEPLNNTAVEIIKATYQFYWVLKPIFLNIEELSVQGDSADVNGTNKTCSYGLTKKQDEVLLREIFHKMGLLGEEELKRQLEDTPDGTPELCRSIVQQKNQRNEETDFLLLIEKLAAQTGRGIQEIYCFLLKFLIGITRGKRIICGLHTNSPYGRILAIRDERSPGFQKIRENSWVPLLLETRYEKGNKERKILDECGQMLAKLDDEAHELYEKLYVEEQIM